MKAADCKARVVAVVASLAVEIAAEVAAVARRVTTAANAGFVFQTVAVAARSHVTSGELQTSQTRKLRST